MEAKKLHPLAEEFHDYLRYYKSERTAYNYSRNVSAFLRWVDKPLEEVTPLDITRWYASLEERGYSPRTVWRFGWALRSFFDVMKMEDLRRKTPVPTPQIPEPRWLEEEDASSLIDEVPVLCVSYDLALRVGEVGFLRRSALNTKTGRIEVRRLKHKGQRDTYILELGGWCLGILNSYLEGRGGLGDVLFPVSTSTIQRIFRRRADAVGLGRDYTFHSLRHSRITHIAIRELEEKGFVDELSLAKFAGHLRVETTRTYVHLATRHLAFGRRSPG